MPFCSPNFQYPMNIPVKPHEHLLRYYQTQSTFGGKKKSLGITPIKMGQPALKPPLKLCCSIKTIGISYVLPMRTSSVRNGTLDRPSEPSPAMVSSAFLALPRSGMPLCSVRRPRGAPKVESGYHKMVIIWDNYTLWIQPYLFKGSGTGRTGV